MKQRKRQLLAFLLAIIFVVSSFAGMGLKANAEELYEAYGYLYPNDDYYGYFDWTEFRRFKIGNGADDIIFDNYDKVWTVPSEGVNNGNIAWVLDTTAIYDEEYGAVIPTYKPTRGKIEIGKNEVDASGNIVMTVEYDDELFSDVNNLSYQWYVYDEKPLTFDFKDMEGTEYWQDPVLNNGKYLFKSKEWTTTEGARIFTPITGKLSSQILSDYEIKTGWRSVKITNLDPIRYDRSAVTLTFEDDGISFSTWTNYERWYDGQGTKIAPADSYEVLVYGIQKYEKAIPGANEKTLTLPKTDPFYDTNKQYYCVISEDVDVLGMYINVIYSSKPVNAHVHQYNKKNVTDKYLASPATYKEAAKYFYACECGEKGTTTYTVGSPLAINMANCSITLAADSYAYKGKAIAAPVTVKNGKTTVDKSKYTVTYKNNTNVGTATVTVKAKDGSGFTGSKSATFKITKAKNAVKATSKYTKTASAKVQTIDLGAKSTFGTVTYKSDNKKVTVSKTGKVTIPKNFIGTAKITAAVNGTANYAAAAKTVTITVNPAKIAVGKLTNPSKGVVKVTWKANDKLTGYNIQYSTSSTFKKNVETVVIKKATTKEKALKGLKKSKTYYVRIRAYKTVSGKTYYSNWSTAKSIKIVK